MHKIPTIKETKMTVNELKELLEWAIDTKLKGDDYSEVYLNNIIYTASKKLEEMANGNPF
jgi:hypothetical protein